MFSVDNILQAGSLIVLALVIFAESGLLLGLFLPGDTLLIAGGIFASEGRLPLGLLLISVVVSTILGYQMGYFIGRRAGPRIFRRKSGVLFREDYLVTTQDFFKRHGGKTILVSRFIAVVRTLVPLIAGMGNMNRRNFFIFNLMGGTVWATSLILLSYWIGQQVPNLDIYIKYLILAATVLTFGAIIIELLKNGAKRRELWAALKEEYRYFFKKKSV